jgi:hypothetical protein
MRRPGAPCRAASPPAIASALRGWPLPLAVETLQKALPRRRERRLRRRAALFRRRVLAAPAAGLGALLRWAAALRRFAEFAEHPWNAELSLESLVGQGREALQTPRSARLRGEVDSVHLRR